MQCQKSGFSWLWDSLLGSALFCSFVSCTFTKRLARKMKRAPLLIIDVSVIEISDLPRVEVD